MPKDKEEKASYVDRHKASPYPSSSNNASENKPKGPSLSFGDEKDWDEVRCPACMEAPHNAVLLLCSSRENGCLPYMCDTSYRHSNCLDQFCKSFADTSSTNLLEELLVLTASGHQGIQSANTSARQQTKLVCPLCRGQITRWVVIEPARHFMNSKRRSCSLETCDFIGNYWELRKHARCEHPYITPTELDVSHQLDWNSMGYQRHFHDLLGTLCEIEFMETALQHDQARQERERYFVGFPSTSLLMSRFDSHTLGWMWMEHTNSVSDLESMLSDECSSPCETGLYFTHQIELETREPGTSGGNFYNQISRSSGNYHNDIIPTAKGADNSSLGDI